VQRGVVKMQLLQKCNTPKKIKLGVDNSL